MKAKVTSKYQEALMISQVKVEHIKAVHRRLQKVVHSLIGIQRICHLVLGNKSRHKMDQNMGSHKAGTI